MSANFTGQTNYKRITRSISGVRIFLAAGRLITSVSEEFD